MITVVERCSRSIPKTFKSPRKRCILPGIKMFVVVKMHFRLDEY